MTVKEQVDKLLDGLTPSKRELTDGSPVPADQSHTKLKDNGQQKAYVVLTAEERAKGFVRPVRTAYMHKGARPKYNLRDLTDEEKVRFDKYNYVKYEEYPLSDSSVVGRFWTQAQLDSGCGTVTTMALSIAETFARKPDFYDGGFCCGCGKHVPNEELVWAGTDIQVGT